MTNTYTPVTAFNAWNAYKLTKGIFPHDAAGVGRSFIASLMPKAFLPFASKLFSGVKLKSLDYFVAIDGNGKAVGVTGLYCVGGRNEAWVGWYGVAPSERGQGYGKELLDWTIRTATQRGFDTLRLWTSTGDDHAHANVLYAGRGFVKQELAGADPSHPNARFVLYGMSLRGQPTESFKGDLREALLGAAARDIENERKRLSRNLT